MTTFHLYPPPSSSCPNPLLNSLIRDDRHKARTLLPTHPSTFPPPPPPPPLPSVPRRIKSTKSYASVTTSCSCCRRYCHTEPACSGGCSNCTSHVPGRILNMVRRPPLESFLASFVQRHRGFKLHVRPAERDEATRCTRRLPSLSH